MNKNRKKDKKGRPTARPLYDQIPSLYYDSEGPELIIDDNFKNEVSSQYLVYRDLESSLLNKVPEPLDIDVKNSKPGQLPEVPTEPNPSEIPCDLIENKDANDIELIEVDSSCVMTEGLTDWQANIRTKTEANSPQIPLEAQSQPIHLEIESQLEKRIKIETENAIIETKSDNQKKSPRKVEQLDPEWGVTKNLEDLESRSVVQPKVTPVQQDPEACKSRGGSQVSIAPEDASSFREDLVTKSMGATSKPLGVKGLIKKDDPGIKEHIREAKAHIKKFMSYYKHTDKKGQKEEISKKQKKLNKQAAKKKTTESKIDLARQEAHINDLFQKPPSNEFDPNLDWNQFRKIAPDEKDGEKQKQKEKSLLETATGGGTAFLNFEVDKNSNRIGQKIQLMSMDIEKDNVYAKKSFNFHYAANDVIIEEILQFKSTMRRAFPHLRRQIHREINREIKVFDYEFPLNSTFMDKDSKDLLYFAPKDIFHFKFIKHIKHNEKNDSYFMEQDDKDPFKFLVADYVENLKYLIEWLNSLGHQPANDLGIHLYNFVKERLGNDPMVSMGNLTAKVTHLKKLNAETTHFKEHYPWFASVYDIDDLRKQYKMVGQNFSKQTLQLLQFSFEDAFVADPWVGAMQSAVTTNWVDMYLARFRKDKPTDAWITAFNANVYNELKISENVEIDFWVKEFYFILPSSGTKIKKTLLFFVEEVIENNKIYEVYTCTIH